MLVRKVAASLPWAQPWLKMHKCSKGFRALSMSAIQKLTLQPAARMGKYISFMSFGLSVLPKICRKFNTLVAVVKGQCESPGKQLTVNQHYWWLSFMPHETQAQRLHTTYRDWDSDDISFKYPLKKIKGKYSVFCQLLAGAAKGSSCL